MSAQAVAMRSLVPRFFKFQANQGSASSRWTRRIVWSLLLAGLVISAQTAFAQPAQSTQPPQPLGLGSGRTAIKAAAGDLDWSRLTPSQQQALAPLAASWNGGMSDSQKRKWLEISKNYGGLSPQAQTTLTSRMKEWAALSPQERAQARLNFGKINESAKELTPEEKKAKWEAYQALTPEEKQKLAANASPKPAGAATALKPVAPQKLVTVPLQSASKPAFIPAPKPAQPMPATGPVPVQAPVQIPSATGAGPQK